jgi:NDP-sugar pyrophosphorylase family protein
MINSNSVETLNIVVPMAGLGSRFSKAGYELPKPLIPVHGVPMIKVVIDNLAPKRPHRFIFVCQREHVAAYDLGARLAVWAPGSQLVAIDGLTEGAACTVLAAKQHIDANAPMMIANSDQYVDTSVDDYLDALDKGESDGLIMTMWADDPKWSFVELADGLVRRVVEKEVISNDATVGIYNFRRGRDFVEGAERMIARNERVNGEFYVAPVYNELIREGARVVAHNIGSTGSGMHGLGTPADLQSFLQHPKSRNWVGALS